jgi:hypothetical protein
MPGAARAGDNAEENLSDMATDWQEVFEILSWFQIDLNGLLRLWTPDYRRKGK